MKNNLLLLWVCLLSHIVFAHDLHYEKVIMKNWSLPKDHKMVEGSFYMLKENRVYIENEKNQVVSYPLTDLSEQDQIFVLDKQAQIEQSNQTLSAQSAVPSTAQTKQSFPYQFGITLLMLLVISGLLLRLVKQQQRKYFVPLIMVGGVFALLGFTQKSMRQLQTHTSPAFIDSAFVPFVPNVHTFYDQTYFYVESKGIPTTHEMMVGISNHGWQQQVPIPQCYIGSNAWSIPLNPVIAANPIPVDSIHFTRGAIAIAANGVPIFNYHTNTGVDSYLDGQLDNYGGHCGRADDYHYHIAPLHLYAHTSTSLPIAFGLDGFAVYGSLEPDGTPMAALDINHGHFGNNGVYHYHGTAAAPYMIGNMVGQVTEDATHQLIPQAAAHPVRPSLTPLNGALITNCQPNATHTGYNVTYTLNGATDSVVYHWNTSGVYTFNFYTVSGLTTNNYNGFVQCEVPATSAITSPIETNAHLSLYPNPAHTTLYLSLSNNNLAQQVQSLLIYNTEGKIMYQTHQYQNTIDLNHFPKGIYLLKLQFKQGQLLQKFVVA